MPVQIDMEMPRSCGDCRFCRTEVFGCVYCDAYGNYGKEISRNIGVSGVLAWRELPEPWEGE